MFWKKRPVDVVVRGGILAVRVSRYVVLREREASIQSARRGACKQQALHVCSDIH